MAGYYSKKINECQISMKTKIWDHYHGYFANNQTPGTMKWDGAYIELQSVRIRPYIARSRDQIVSPT